MSSGNSVPGPGQNEESHGARRPGATAYPVEAVIELSGGLHLGPEFLGLQSPAAIGGIEVDIALPDFSRNVTDDEFDGLLHPRARAEWTEILGEGELAEEPRWPFEERMPEEEPRWPFGSVIDTGDDGEITGFFATRLLALPKGQLTVEEARALKGSADDWLRRLETWIEVVARVDLRQETARMRREGPSAFVWIGRGETARGALLCARPEIIRISLSALLEVSVSQWERMLAKTSAGIEPPDVDIFLRDGRQERNAGRFRRSVLDSATATELSLSRLRDDFIAGGSRPSANASREAAEGIADLTRFLKGVEVDIPRRIQQEVGEPRNDAIHQGEQLDEVTAGMALEKAEEVVDVAFPRNDLL